MIGRPLPDIRMYVLDARMEPVPRGVIGELYVGGGGVARGYLGRPGLTASRFVPDPYSDHEGGRLYRTGDLVRYFGDGDYAYVGRADRQVKVRGYRIELGEIEAALRAHSRVDEAVVELRAGAEGERRLVAYVSGEQTTVEVLREYLGDRLPDYMVPSAFVWFEKLPLTANGKVDRAALTDPGTERPALSARYEGPRSPAEQTVADVWQEVLGVERVGIHDNFFDLGGTSLTILKVKDRAERLFRTSIPTVVFFQRPTVAQLASAILAATENAVPPAARKDSPRSRPVRRAALSPPVAAAAPDIAPTDIAIIGIAGRFPGAADVSALWANLCAGRESITVFSEEDLLSASVAPTLVRDARYVRARGTIEGVEEFDYEFFGFNPRDAQLTDPQHRLFLESCWQALTDAAYVPDRVDVPVGVFGGTGPNHYRDIILAGRSDTGRTHGAAEREIGNEKDYLTTTVSYRLRLTGPSLDVQTACSTSLVAVHMACRSLIASECDMALAGGVSVVVPQTAGYLYAEGGIGSPDGHCRAFDKDASGCVPGNGAGVVVLKRLADAVADGDYVYAVIKGSAINNDGARKVGFAAPSVDGQADVIRRALGAARVEPRDVGYVEAHGTGTALGDPIEIEALRHAFETSAARSCGLGSVKTNIGHLDAAAGIAGLIKTILAIAHRRLPGSLHFREANPQIDFSTTPFFIVPRLSKWRRRAGPLVAGVSSFGIGGTNAHVIVSSAPERTDVRPAKGRDVVVLSARTPEALEQSRANLAAHLREHAGVSFEDLCCTLQAGRPAMLHRLAFSCRNRREAVDLLTKPLAPAQRGVPSLAVDRKVMFMFPGQGSMRLGPLRALYRSEPVFRDEVDGLSARLPAVLATQMEIALGRTPAAGRAGDHRLGSTRVAQPLHLVLQLALANTWRRLGIEPAAVIGHSLGELSAAVVAGVFLPEDALRVAAARGALMEETADGRMLAVGRSAEATEPELFGSLAIAAENAPSVCTVSGSPRDVTTLAGRLRIKRVPCRPLAVNRSFHSSSMDAAIAPLVEVVRGIDRRPPTMPIVSSLSGDWIRAEEICDPGYWGEQARRQVRFRQAVHALKSEGDLTLLEIGTDGGLAAFAQQGLGATPGTRVIRSLRPPARGQKAGGLERALAELWESGARVDWVRYRAGARGRRVPLPGYPFERRRCWVDAAKRAPEATGPEMHWHSPVWRRVAAVSGRADDDSGVRRVMVIAPTVDMATAIRSRCRVPGREVITVVPAAEYRQLSVTDFAIRPRVADDYRALVSTLGRDGRMPDTVVHAIGTVETTSCTSTSDPAKSVHAEPHSSLLLLARALDRHAGVGGIRWHVLAKRLFNVTGDELRDPERAMLGGAVEWISREPRCAHAEVCEVDADADDVEVAGRVLERLSARPEAQACGRHSLRGRHRWSLSLEDISAFNAAPGVAFGKPGGVYLLTGTPSPVWIALCEHFSSRRARALILLSDDRATGASTWPPFVESVGSHVDITTCRPVLFDAIRADTGVYSWPCDLTDERAIRARIRASERHVGPISGVVHSPLLPGPCPCPDDDVDVTSEVLRRSLNATAAVHAAASDRALDFFVCLDGDTGIADRGNESLRCLAAAYAEALLENSVGRDGTPRLVVRMAGPPDGWVSEGAPSSTPGQQSVTRKTWDALGALVESGISCVTIASGGRQYGPARALTAATTLDAAASSRGEYARSNDGTPPGSSLREQVASVLCELLGVPAVHADKSLFEVGGHSLMAVEFATELRTRFEIDVALRDVFEHPSVDELANLIGRRQAAAMEHALLEQVLQEVEGVAPGARPDRGSVVVPLTVPQEQPEI